jgi:hypothetical protein
LPGILSDRNPALEKTTAGKIFFNGYMNEVGAVSARTVLTTIFFTSHQSFGKYAVPPTAPALCDGVRITFPGIITVRKAIAAEEIPLENARVFSGWFCRKGISLRSRGILHDKTRYGSTVHDPVGIFRKPAARCSGDPDCTSCCARRFPVLPGGRMDLLPVFRNSGVEKNRP